MCGTQPLQGGELHQLTPRVFTQPSVLNLQGAFAKIFVVARISSYFKGVCPFHQINPSSDFTTTQQSKLGLHTLLSHSVWGSHPSTELGANKEENILVQHLNWTGKPSMDLPPWWLLSSFFSSWWHLETIHL